VNDVYAIVRSIRENRFSRNQHFEEHLSEASVEARRVHRFLRAIERDLDAASDVRVRRHERGGYTVSMRFPKVRLWREVSLTPEEYALLVEEPRLATLLQPIQ
jgi:hypothetical protein